MGLTYDASVAIWVEPNPGPYITGVYVGVIGEPTKRACLRGPTGSGTVQEAALKGILFALDSVDRPGHTVVIHSSHKAAVDAIRDGTAESALVQAIRTRLAARGGNTQLVFTGVNAGHAGVARAREFVKTLWQTAKVQAAPAAPARTFSASDRHRFGVIELCEKVHGAVTGTGDPMLPEDLKLCADWLDWRGSEGWEGTKNPLHAKYEQCVHELLIAAMNEARVEIGS